MASVGPVGGKGAGMTSSLSLGLRHTQIGGSGPSQVPAQAGGMRHGNFSKRRTNHPIYDHKKDSFIEWLKSVLMSTFDLDVMDEQIPISLAHVEALVYVLANEGRLDVRQRYRNPETSTHVTAICVIDVLMSTFDLDVMDEQIPISLAHVEALVREHVMDDENSRLRRILPDVPTFFTRLKLKEAFQIYNKKYRITKRRFVYPTFNEIRHIVNLAQVLAIDDLKLMTFDGDQTLYPDQKNLEDLALAQQLLVLLQSDVKIALVTAANYGLDGPKYEVRLQGLLDYFRLSELEKRYLNNFYIVAGESNFLLKINSDYRIEGAQEQWNAGSASVELTENMKTALDACEQTLRTAISDMNMKAQCGCIQSSHAVKAGEQSYYFRREQLDEMVYRLQETLISIRDKIDFPYCAFNGGNDVWFDIGNKKEGIAGLQDLLKIRSENCLHVGDQMARTGNDFMARFISPVCWIVNPSETKKILKHVIRKIGGPKKLGELKSPKARSVAGSFKDLQRGRSGTGDVDRTSMRQSSMMRASESMDGASMGSPVGGLAQPAVGLGEAGGSTSPGMPASKAPSSSPSATSQQLFQRVSSSGGGGASSSGGGDINGAGGQRSVSWVSADGTAERGAGGPAGAASHSITIDTHAEQSPPMLPDSHSESSQSSGTDLLDGNSSAAGVFDSQGNLLDASAASPAGSRPSSKVKSGSTPK